MRWRRPAAEARHGDAGKALSMKGRQPIIISAFAASCLVIFATTGYALAQSEKQTVITGTLVSVSDRLPPDEVKDIVTEQNFVFTLSGSNKVSESWRRAVIHASAMRAGKTLPGPNIERNVTLGGQSGVKVVWTVKGPHQLQQIMEGKQMIRIMDISIDGDRCAVSVKFLLQQGHTDIINKRFDNGEEAHFTLPRLQSASCEIR